MWEVGAVLGDLDCLDRGGADSGLEHRGAVDKVSMSYCSDRYRRQAEIVLSV